MKIRLPAVQYWAPAVVVGVVIGGAAIGGAVPSSKPAAKATAAPAAAHPATAAARPAHLPGYNEDRNAYFGDLHVHTQLSFDAYIFNVRRSPDDAYRFAKGEAIGHAAGYQVRLAGGPLDFAAVTDHSEYMGAIRESADPHSPLNKLPIVKGLFSTDPKEINTAFTTMVEGYEHGTLPAEFSDPAIASRAWTEVRDAAARNNQPGRFTTFVGYEFTSAPDGRNLHRNVIFRTAQVPGLPFTANNSRDPENLWRTMDGWRSKGIEALAIPHNSNGSDGLCSTPSGSTASPWTGPMRSFGRATNPWPRSPRSKGRRRPIPPCGPMTNGPISRSWRAISARPSRSRSSRAAMCGARSRTAS